MATSNVPRPTFGDRGFSSPPEPDVLTGVMQDMNDAFNGGLNPSLETPQGQLSTSLTAIIGNANDTFVYLANQVDPAHAEGRMQDAIGRIYNLERNPSQPTVVAAVCAGLTGVILPVGTLAIAMDGSIYQSTEQVEIPVGGSIVVQFANTKNGAIPCPDGTLNQIYKAVNGWESIINLTDGVLGNEVESRSEFEARRQNSVALNSRGSMPSILGAVLDVDNVLDAYVTENVNSTPITIGGYTLKPKSLYVAAVGGDSPYDVALAIWNKKAPGCAYNGTTEVTIVDNFSGYTFPFPQYEVSYQIPRPLPNLFEVRLVNNSQVPDNVVELVQNAIIQAFAGADGGARPRIGSTIYASRFYGPILALGTWAQIVSIRIGSENQPSATVTGSIAGFVLTVTGVTTGALAVGQTISKADDSVLSGTRIISLGTGTGGVGTYNLNVTQTIPSGVLHASRAANDLVDVGIDQVPTVAASDIQVTLQ